MALRLQELIHKWEVGAGARYIKAGSVAIAILTLGVLYNFFAFRNMSSPEAMDMAQLGRNISEGKGYSTLFIRPISVFIVLEKNGGSSAALKEAHPDLANPPVYPTLLAALLKVLPRQDPKTSPKQYFVARYDLYIAIFNQLIFLAAVVVLFFLARRLFDPLVAWLSAALFFGADIYWRFSVSGLNTMFLMLLLLVTVWCLVLLEGWVRENRRFSDQVLMAVIIGILLGILSLTRYAMAWLLIPVLIYVLLFTGPKRGVMALAILLSCLTILAPWVGRNVMASGYPFGIATFSALQETRSYPDDRLERSLDPSFRKVAVADYVRKLLENSREIFQTDLPKLGGSWISAFFLAGLFVPFRTPALSRLRWLVVMGLAMSAVVQALGRTYLSEETPIINSDNQLALWGPLVIMFGIAFCLILLDTVRFPFPMARMGALAAIVALGTVPLLFTFLPPRSGPVAYPPYYPPIIEQTSGWLKNDELLMTDIPWATAWYGRRQSMWIPLNWQKDFYAISDYHKRVAALYLTPRTTDSRFLSNWVKGEHHSWANFLLQSMSHKEVPAGFPLRKAPEGFFPEQLFLTDYERWRIKGQQQ